MKCSAVHLLNRSEISKRKFSKNNQRNNEPVYITKGYHGYAFTFLQSSKHVARKPPILSVNNIQLPESVHTLNAGYSLTKWANKIPRLKSATSNRAPSKTHDLDSECDMSYDLNNILEGTDNNEIQESSENYNAEEYEMHSDIEELIRQSTDMRHRREEEDERERDGKRTNEDKSRKRKHRLKKTIRFSFSKPASPQTEQVIRVDVTSNISVEELMQMESSRSETRTDDRSKNSPKGIIDCGRKQLDRNFNEKAMLKLNGEDEEFIIRCSQLALTHKKR